MYILKSSDDPHLHEKITPLPQCVWERDIKRAGDVISCLFKSSDFASCFTGGLAHSGGIGASVAELAPFRGEAGKHRPHLGTPKGEAL